MPIYEYSCTSCGSRKEHLQKISEPKLTVCPACGKETYEKQLTAAGFQLKGSGWYVTDFRNKDGGSSGKSTGVASGSESKSESTSGSKDGGAKEGATDGSAKTVAASSDAPATSSAPAAGT